MDLEQKLFWKCTYVILTSLSYALSSSETIRGTCCGGDFGLNYTLPMFEECKSKQHPNGSMVQTIPKLIPFSSAEVGCLRRKNEQGNRWGNRICRFPDCATKPCGNDRCEETVEGYKCHCSNGSQGGNCSEKSTPLTDTIIGSTTNTTSLTSVQPETHTSPARISDGGLARIFVSDVSAHSIFVADLQDELVFTPIPSSEAPIGLDYDASKKKIYWFDSNDNQIYRADLSGKNRESVTSNKPAGPVEIAIAQTSRTLYASYPHLDKITTVSLELDIPGKETDFLTEGLQAPRAMAPDEEQGYLYVTVRGAVLRTFLNGTGIHEVIYRHENLSALTALSIDRTRSIRRIFFHDAVKMRSFYKDLYQSSDQSFDADIHTAHELTEYVRISDEALRYMGFFNDVIYWVKRNKPEGVVIMKDYDHDNRSHSFYDIKNFKSPRRIHIANMEP